MSLNELQTEGSESLDALKQGRGMSTTTTSVSATSTDTLRSGEYDPFENYNEARRFKPVRKDWE